MTEHKDMGVVSTKSFTKGQLVCEYAGDLITLTEAKVREAQSQKVCVLNSIALYFHKHA